MIRAVFFDFYGTLAHWSPSAEGIQRAAAAEEGLDLDEAALARGYFAADAYMDAENARLPIRSRPPAAVDAFFAQYELILLREAGADVPLDTAGRIWRRVRVAPKEMALFPDAKQTLAAVKAMGVALGVISNIGAELDGWLDRLGIAADLPVRATSGTVGVAKPHPAIFQAALDAAGVAACEAVHVGDSVDGDVEGALRAGLTPVYVQRDASAPAPEGVRVAASLGEAAQAVRELVAAGGG